MAILVSRGESPSYLVYTQREFMAGLAVASDEQKPRVRVKMHSSASGRAALLRVGADDLELSYRAHNCISKGGRFKYAYQLAMMSDAELLRIDGLGKVSLAEIRCVLHEVGFDGGHWKHD